MKAYSLDLRERVLQALDRGLSKADVVRLFRISRATVKRYMSLNRTIGSYAPKTSPGRPRRIDRSNEPALVAQLKATPDAILAEHCATWQQTHHTHVSVATMQRSIRRVRWTRKKRR